MHRDDEYMRELLFEIEDWPRETYVTTRSLNPTPDLEKKNHHLTLLCDCDLLVEVDRRQVSAAYRMTNTGHDFTKALRDDTVWAKTKKAISSAGGYLTLELMVPLALEAFKAELTSRLGISK